MSKFMKGVYSVSSGAQILCDMGCEPGLEFFENMSPSGKVNSETINVKTSDFSSTSAARSSSVHKMDLRFRQFKSNGVLFKIPELTKCSGPKRPLKELSLVSFPPDRRWCFVKYLRRYEKVTERLRNNSNNNSSILFFCLI